VTAADSGDVLVIATSEGKADTSSVRVYLPVAAVRLAPSTATLVVGQMLTLVATTLDSLGHVLTGRSITWITTNAAKATVSSTGLVTAVDSGGVVVRATSEGKFANASLAIQLAAVGNVTLAVSGSGIILPGATRTVTATVTDANGKPLAGRRVTWASSTPAVGTITPDATPSVTGSNGQATATFRAAFFGQTSISATVDGKSGSVIITVP
jgi:uncharacterized protein YjdB